MKVERKRWDDVTILQFIGEFDAFNLPTFSSKIDAILEGGDTRLVFNLRLLTFINSSALGYLLKTKKRAMELGGDLALVAPSKFIKKTLVTLGLQEVFRIYENDEDGVLSFKRPGEIASVKISSADAERDEKLSGANAALFKVIDEAGKDLFGQTQQVGRIDQLQENGLLFTWEIPAPGPKHLVPISSENFDAAIHPGTRLRLKFRQPFALKSYYFEMASLVTRVTKAPNEDGKTAATVHVDYAGVKPEDRSALSGLVADLKRFRAELGKAGEQV